MAEETRVVCDNRNCYRWVEGGYSSHSEEFGFTRVEKADVLWGDSRGYTSQEEKDDPDSFPNNYRHRDVRVFCLGCILDNDYADWEGAAHILDYYIDRGYTITHPTQEGMEIYALTVREDNCEHC